MSRALGPWLVTALVALISAGCGSDARSGTDTASSATRQATDQDEAVKFAECVRNNGVGDFPDPNAKGEFVYGVSVSPAVWEKAVDACKDLQPPGSLSAERDPGQQSAALRFARCMRENGVKDFPDPANGEPLVDTNEIPSSAGPGGMSILDAAMQKCRDVMAEAAAGR